MTDASTDASTDTSASGEMLRYFDASHLSGELARVSRACADLAHVMVGTLPPGPERVAGLRKLLEAKDCFVRAALTARE